MTDRADVIREELMQQVVSHIGNRMFTDNHPERDSSGGEAEFMGREQIDDLARELVQALNDG